MILGGNHSSTCYGTRANYQYRELLTDEVVAASAVVGEGEYIVCDSCGSIWQYIALSNGTMTWRSVK